MRIRDERGFLKQAVRGGLAALGCVVALAGCGTSSPTYARNAPTQQGSHTPSQSNADVKQSISIGATKSTKHLGARNVQKGRSTAASEDDNSSGVPQQPNPCRLVSLSEAQSITAGSITSQIEAPLGPSCIYRRSGAGAEITLAVEASSASGLRRQMHAPAPLAVGSRQGFCGRLGTPMLLVPLTGGRVLQVSAPCPIAKQFAARALARLAA